MKVKLKFINRYEPSGLSQKTNRNRNWTRADIPRLDAVIQFTIGRKKAPDAELYFIRTGYNEYSQLDEQQTERLLNWMALHPDILPKDLTIQQADTAIKTEIMIVPPAAERIIIP